MKTIKDLFIVKKIQRMVDVFNDCVDVIGKYSRCSLYLDRFFFF